MNFYKSNLKLLKLYRPQAYGTLMNFDDRDSKVQWSDADGTNVSYLVKGKSVPLYQVSAEETWKQSSELSLLKNPKILVVHGLGCGDHVDQLIDVEGVESKYILFLEKNIGLFKAFLEKRDLTSLLTSSRFEIMLDVPGHLMLSIFRDYFLIHDRLIYQKRIEHFYFKPALDFEGEYYLKMAQSMPKAVESLVSLYHAPAEDCYNGFMNVVQNISKLPRFGSVDHLENLHMKKPAIIVSSGPSLDLHLDALEKEQKKFIIICSDSSLKLLWEHKIRPDFVVTLERDKLIENLFDDFPKDCDVPMIAMPTAYPTVFERYPGPVLMLSRQSNFGKWLWPDNVYFHVGSTVASMALRMLNYMGCDQVYLLGQDLAYDRNSNASHMTGVSAHAQELESDRRETDEYCELEGNDGNLIASTIYWRMFLNVLNQMMNKFPAKCYNVIPKDRGALLQNADRIDPDLFWSETVLKLPVLDLNKKQIQQMDKSFNAGGDAVYYKDLLTKGLAFLSQVLDRSMDLSDVISEKKQNDYPIKYSQDLVDDYSLAFKNWDKELENIKNIDYDLFQNLLDPLSSNSKFNLLTARESMIPDEKSYIKYIFEYASFTLEYHKNLQYWACRIKKRLEEIKAKCE